MSGLVLPVAAGVADVPARSPAKAPLRAWYSLAVLAIVTLIAFVDRNVVVLQAEVIRKALGLSDVQLGVLQGTASAAFAAVATFPLAWLADRLDRRLVLAGCALFWSLAVVGCGLARSYEELLLASALVGAGEAGLVPISYAIIPDIFGERQRPLANAVFAVAAMSATSLALALCGQVIGGVGALGAHLPPVLAGLDAWRLAFLAVALPAPLLVLLIATVASRGRAPAARELAKAPAPALLPHVKANRATLAYFTAGLFIALFGFNAVGAWLPVIYQRHYGVPADKLGGMMGGAALIALVIGLPTAVYGMRFFKARIGVRVNVRVLWMNCAVAIAVIVGMTLVSTAYQMLAVHGVYLVMLTATMLVFPGTLQALAPAPLRARTVAVLGMVTSAGSACAPPVTGFVSDHLHGVSNGLMLSAAIVSIPALVLAVILFARSERHYVATAEAVERAERDPA